jgi:hypothetical protein
MTKEITIDGIVYIPKNIKENDIPYVLIRTYSAGVHIGYLQKKESTLAGMEVTLLKSRRIWYWSGAASLSQLAMEGVIKPEDCKFAMEVDKIDLVAIEIIPITEKAFINLKSVKEWKK